MQVGELPQLSCDCRPVAFLRISLEAHQYHGTDALLDQPFEDLTLCPATIVEPTEIRGVVPRLPPLLPHLSPRSQLPLVHAPHSTLLPRAPTTRLPAPPS